MNKQNGKAPNRRPVESEYLAKLNGAVSLDAWGKIVERAVEDATNGDPKARDWLTKHVIGTAPPKLLDVVAQDVANVTVDQAIEQRANEIKERAFLQNVMNGR